MFVSPIFIGQLTRGNELIYRYNDLVSRSLKITNSAPKNNLFVPSN